MIEIAKKQCLICHVELSEQVSTNGKMKWKNLNQFQGGLNSVQFNCGQVFHTNCVHLFNVQYKWLMGSAEKGRCCPHCRVETLNTPKYKEKISNRSSIKNWEGVELSNDEDFSFGALYQIYLFHRPRLGEFGLEDELKFFPNLASFYNELNDYATKKFFPDDHKMAVAYSNSEEEVETFVIEDAASTTFLITSPKDENPEASSIIAHTKSKIYALAELIDLYMVERPILPNFNHEQGENILKSIARFASIR